MEVGGDGWKGTVQEFFKRDVVSVKQISKQIKL